MESVVSDLTACQLVQLYTAHGEQTEELARRLRRIDRLAMRRQLAEEAAENLQMRSGFSFSGRNANPENRNQSVAILRHPQAIVGLSMIVNALEIRVGLSVYYEREYIYMSEQDSSLEVKMNDDSDIKKGVALIISTPKENLHIILSNVVGNWRLKKLDFMNVTYRPRDLIFYSTQFSFCCQSLNAYSKMGGRISMHSFSMDVILAGE